MTITAERPLKSRLTTLKSRLVAKSLWPMMLLPGLSMKMKSTPGVNTSIDHWTHLTNTLSGPMATPIIRSQMSQGSSLGSSKQSWRFQADKTGLKYLSPKYALLRAVNSHTTSLSKASSVSHKPTEHPSPSSTWTEPQVSCLGPSTRFLGKQITKWLNRWTQHLPNTVLSSIWLPKQST